MGESEAKTIRQPRDRLKGQPQEREHSDAAGGTRDRLPPARGADCLARGIEARRVESRFGSTRESPTGSAGRASYLLELAIKR